MPRPRRTEIEPVAINGSAGSVETGDRQPEGGSQEPAKLEFPAPISPIDAGLATDTGTDIGESTEQPARTKRKWTRRTFHNAENEKTIPDLSDLKDLIFSVHLALSAVVPELELDQAEAKRYADATGNLMKHYDNKLNPKVLAWMQFVSVTGGIYGPRAVAWYKRSESGRTHTSAAGVSSAPRSSVGPQSVNKTAVPTTPAEIWPVEPLEN